MPETNQPSALGSIVTSTPEQDAEQNLVYLRQHALSVAAGMGGSNVRPAKDIVNDARAFMAFLKGPPKRAK